MRRHNKKELHKSMIINLRTRSKTQILLAEAQSNQNQKIRIKKFEGAMHKTLTL